MSCSRGRETYRAVYLSAPLKFCTTLHAFKRPLPRFHIDAWQKDPYAWHRHKWRVSKQRKQGKWFYGEGPLAGLRLAGWPDPGLLGASELVQVAARAQRENLQDTGFWWRTAERTYKLRDVMSVGDLAVVVDSLLTANYRHTQLMKTLTREFIDDIDKMSLVEVAVVVNAYAHFNCVSMPLLAACARHAAQLLPGPGRGELEADPKSLSVLTKAFASLGYHNDGLLVAINGAVVEHAASVDFAVLSDVLVSFAALGQAFAADEGAWAAFAAKVPGSRMTSLCPALRASAQLRVSRPPLRAALVEEIVRGIMQAPTPPAPAPLGAALGLWSAPHAEATPRRLPAFAARPMPEQMFALTPSRAATEVSTVEDEVVSQDGAVVEWSDTAPLGEDMSSGQDASKTVRWYNTVQRCMFGNTQPSYAEFDASEQFARNRRGALVAEALEGLNCLWQEPPDAAAPVAEGAGADPAATCGATGAVTDPAGALPAAEAELARAAMPVLRSTMQGLSTAQLVSCAEVYTHGPLHGGGGGALPADAAELVRDIIQESVRKLSNFSSPDILRLYTASLRAGVKDPYLDRARYRRFPKALRNDLRDRVLPSLSPPA